MSIVAFLLFFFYNTVCLLGLILKIHLDFIMETLAKIFGSETKVKILRLFLFNQDSFFDIDNIADRVKENPIKVRKEINALEKIAFIKKKSLYKGLVKKGKKQVKKFSFTFGLNPNFTYIAPLYNLLINSKPLEPKELSKKISDLGSIKLLIVSGVFTQDKESRVDMLIVGDNVKNSSLEHTIKNIEAELGKEVRYAFFTLEDFTYRLRMFDKLIRDILDYPHEKIINKIGNI